MDWQNCQSLWKWISDHYSIFYFAARISISCWNRYALRRFLVFRWDCCSWGRADSDFISHRRNGLSFPFRRSIFTASDSPQFAAISRFWYWKCPLSCAQIGFNSAQFSSWVRQSGDLANVSRFRFAFYLNALLRGASREILISSTDLIPSPIDLFGRSPATLFGFEGLRSDLVALIGRRLRLQHDPRY